MTATLNPPTDTDARNARRRARIRARDHAGRLDRFEKAVERLERTGREPGDLLGLLERDPARAARTAEAVAAYDVVPNRHLREEFVARNRRDPARYSASSVAYRAGFLRKASGGASLTGDAIVLARRLGLAEQSDSVKNGVRYGGGFRQFIDYAHAVAIATALDLAPHEAGV